ncbi:hypothetical protein GF314_01030 [bacterium]|nr:hypothetical protein [bacterium]
MHEMHARRLFVATHRDDLPQVAAFLARQAGVEPADPPPTTMSGGERRSWRSLVDRLEFRLRQVAAVSEKLAIDDSHGEIPTDRDHEGMPPEVGADDRWAGDLDQLDRLEEDVGRLTDLVQEREQDAATLRSDEISLARLVDLELPPRDAARSGRAHVMFGVVDADEYTRTSVPRLDTPLVVIPLVSLGSGLLVASAALPRDRAVLERFLRTIGHQPIDLPAGVPDDAAALLDDLRRRQREVDEELADLRRRLVTMREERSAWLADLDRRLAGELAAARLVADHAVFEELVLLVVLIPDDRARELVDGVHALAGREHVVVLGQSPDVPARATMPTGGQ